MPGSSSAIFKVRFRETRKVPAGLALARETRARYPDRCSKRRLAGEKIGATGFEPATCRRGDRSMRMY